MGEGWGEGKLIRQSLLKDTLILTFSLKGKGTAPVLIKYKLIPSTIV